MLDKETIPGQLISRRTFIIGAGKLGMLFLLAGRMFYMQFVKKDEYRTLSDRNRISMIIIPSVRGQILDRHKRPMVKNNTCFRLLLDKNGNPKFNEDVELVGKILELDAEQLEIVKKRMKKAGRKIPAVLIDFLDWKQISVIEERKPELKSIFVDTGYSRIYHNPESTAHLLGYLGKAKKKPDQEAGIFDENFTVGRSGIEEFYEPELRGEFGYKQVEVNAFGRYVRLLNTSQSLAGKDLHLNIDFKLQQAIMPLLSQYGCSTVVMDCQSGAVLALSSSPSFDPNQFNKLSREYWNSLINNPYKPLINKTIQSLYPPGSVFKIITALAALEHGVDPERKFFCSGGPALGGNSFRCSSRAGHGPLSMIEALQFSCNSYMYAIAQIIGPDKILEVAERFGFGKKTGIDLPGELGGFIPSREWKKERFGSKWTVGDTLNLAIGQGFTLCTPLQLVRMISALASGGKLFTPRISAELPPEFEQIHIHQQHLHVLKEALYRAVNQPGGTGYYSRFNHNGSQMAGKTGTAQVMAKASSTDDLSRANIAWNRRNHAIFCGYAPHEEPRFAVSVYYDHGGGGGKAAAPIGSRIMQEVLNNQFHSEHS